MVVFIVVSLPKLNEKNECDNRILNGALKKFKVQ